MHSSVLALIADPIARNVANKAPMLLKLQHRAVAVGKERIEGIAIRRTQVDEDALGDVPRRRCPFRIVRLALARRSGLRLEFQGGLWEIFAKPRSR